MILPASQPASFASEGDVRALSPYERGVLESRMAPGSAARTIGRSEAWVIRMRAELAAPAAPAPAPVLAERRTPRKGGRPPKVPAPEPAAPRAWSVRPRRLGSCRRFLAAGWTVPEVAWLFDLHVDELEAAI